MQFRQQQPQATARLVIGLIDMQIDAAAVTLRSRRSARRASPWP